MKLSIIVPVYNSSLTVERCIDSILNQSIVEKEIIIINDGSTDNSLDIINKYKKNTNIILINQNNQGQGVARNRALEIAKGEYVTFVDSDDYLSNRYSYENLIMRCDNENLDLIIFNYCIDYISHYKILVNLYNDKIYTSKEIIEKFLLTNEVEGFSCNKIFKKKIISDNNIKFLEGYKYEDIPFVIDYILMSNNIGFDNNVVYHYTYNTNSTTKKINLNVLKDEIYSMKLILTKINNTSIIDLDSIVQYANNRIKLYRTYRLKNVLKGKITLKEFFLINKIYNDFLKEIHSFIHEK